MSVTVMGAVWWSTIEGSSKRFVLLALADRADDDGYCYPGVENLTQKTGLSEATVKRMLRELRADNLLRTSYRWAADGSQDTNESQINMPLLESMRRPREDERGRGRRPTETRSEQPETRAERKARETGGHGEPPTSAPPKPQVTKGGHHDPPVTMTPPGGSPRPRGGVTTTPNTSLTSEEIPLTPGKPGGSALLDDHDDLGCAEHGPTCHRRACGRSQRQRASAARAAAQEASREAGVLAQITGRDARAQARERAATAGGADRQRALELARAAGRRATAG